MEATRKNFEVELLPRDETKPIQIVVEASWWPEAKALAEELNPGCNILNIKEPAPEVISGIHRFPLRVWRFIKVIAVALILIWVFVGFVGWFGFYWTHRPRTHVDPEDYKMIANILQGPQPKSLDIIQANVRWTAALQGEPYAYYEARVDAGELIPILQKVRTEVDDTPSPPHFLIQLGYEESDTKRIGSALTQVRIFRPYSTREKRTREKQISSQVEQSYPPNLIARNQQAMHDEIERGICTGTLYFDATNSPSLNLYIAAGWR